MRQRLITWANAMPRFLYPTLDCRPGEKSLETTGANRSLATAAVGGRLTVTDKRIAFIPHRLQRRRWRWECALAGVRRVWVEPIGKGWLDGSKRERLGIEETDGGIQLFVVFEPARLAEVIRRAYGDSA
jgi:hypothetical protein